MLPGICVHTDPVALDVGTSGTTIVTVLALERLGVQVDTADVHLQALPGGEAAGARLAMESSIQVLVRLGRLLRRKRGGSRGCGRVCRRERRRRHTRRRSSWRRCPQSPPCLAFFREDKKHSKRVASSPKKKKCQTCSKTSQIFKRLIKKTEIPSIAHFLFIYVALKAVSSHFLKSLFLILIFALKTQTVIPT